MTRTDPHDCPTTPFGLPCMCTVAERAVLHETPTHWVTSGAVKGRRVYYVWRHAPSGTHGVRVATYDLGERGRTRAIEDCDQRSERAQ